MATLWRWSYSKNNTLLQTKKKRDGQRNAKFSISPFFPSRGWATRCTMWIGQLSDKITWRKSVTPTGACSEQDFRMETCETASLRSESMEKTGGNKWMEHLMWYYKAQTLGKPEMRVRWQSVASFQCYGLSSPPFGTCSLPENCSQLWDCLLAWPLDHVGIEKAHPVMIVFFLTFPCPCMKQIQNNAQAPAGILIFLFLSLVELFWTAPEATLYLLLCSNKFKTNDLFLLSTVGKFNNVFLHLFISPSSMFTLK